MSFDFLINKNAIKIDFPTFDAFGELNSAKIPRKVKMSEKIKCAILTCSDRCASSENEDRSGPNLGELVRQDPLNAELHELKIVPDEIETIKKERPINIKYQLIIN